MDLKNKPLRNRRVAVIGAGIAEGEIYELAYTVGKLLAENGAIVYTGGLGGVMEAVSKDKSLDNRRGFNAIPSRV